MTTTAHSAAATFADERPWLPEAVGHEVGYSAVLQVKISLYALQAFEEGGGGKKAEAHRALAEAKAADGRPAPAESKPETAPKEEQQQKQRDGPDPRFASGHAARLLLVVRINLLSVTAGWQLRGAGCHEGGLH